VKIDFKNIVLFILVLAAAITAAYFLGLNKGMDKVAETAPPSPVISSDNPAMVPPPLDPATAGQTGANPEASFTHFRVGNRNVKSIYMDGDIVWVGTSGGVIRYDTSSDDYRLFDVKNGLLANGVFYVGRIANVINIGTYGGGLALYDEVQDKFDIYNVPEGLAAAFVYDALGLPNGDVWIATWSGANRIPGGDLKNQSKWETYTVENTSGGLPNDWVYGLTEGKNGEVWFATEGGLARYLDGKWDNWSHPDGLGAAYDMVKEDNQFDNDPAELSSHHARQKVEMNLQDVDTAYNPNYIVSLEIDQEGIVWVGTWGAGLASFDGETFKNYTVKDGLPANHIFMLHLDQHGKLWIGTSGGLATFKEDGFDVMTVDDGLFNNTIFSMATHDDGTLWVGSFGGVARIKP